MFLKKYDNNTVSLHGRNEHLLIINTYLFRFIKYLE